MKEIRLGTIGSGNIVHNFLDGVRRTENIRLVAVYSRSEEKARALAAGYEASKVYTDMAAFLDDDEMNFVYIASPNMLHYEQTKQALLAGKNVICEKPFCTKSEQAKELAAIARVRDLYLIDAVPTTFLPNYQILLKELPKIGRIKLVQGNYSQYSSRYDLLLQGEVTNVFNPEFGGGSLMDINFYNIFLNVALFGKPCSTVYFPNIYPNLVDTSGIVVMQYEDFVSESTGAKDTWGVNFFQIEGEDGYIYIKGGSNGLSEIELVTNDSRQVFNDQGEANRWYYEVLNITKSVLNEEKDALNQRLDLMVDVMEVLEDTRKKAGILFPGE